MSSLLLAVAYSLRPGAEVALLQPTAGGAKGVSLASSLPTPEPKKDLRIVMWAEGSSLHSLYGTTRCDSGRLLRADEVAKAAGGAGA